MIPFTDFGREPATALEPERLEFARRVLPALIEVSRADGNTDGVAEALVCSALLGQAHTPAHREAVAWVLSRRRADGAYVSQRDLGRDLRPDHFRHVVLTASWALMVTLKGMDPSDAAGSVEARPSRSP